MEGIKPVPPEQWHITLRFLGEVDMGLIPALIDSLGTASEALAGVRCDVGPSTAWFSGDRVLQIPARGLDRVARAVRGATIPIVPESGRGASRFRGHVTVARTRSRSVDPSARMEVAGIPFVATFEVGFFDLVKSERVDECPAYTTLARFRIAR